MICAGLIDLYFTILHYEGNGAISNMLQKGIWKIFRSLSAMLPLSSRSLILSHGAPIMIICTLLLWIGLEITGFAFVYYAGMNSSNFIFLTKDISYFQTAFYFSSVTLPTLGFGDVVPVSTFFRTTAAVESLIGFAIMTLSLSFILNIYKVIQQFRILASSLYHQISPANDVWMIVKRNWHNFRFEADNEFFRDLHQRLLDWYENLHQFPIAYYFYSPREFLSIPYTFKIIGELLAALRFGFPKGHSISTNSYIQSLMEAYISICNEIIGMYHSPIKTHNRLLQKIEKQLKESDVNADKHKCFNSLCSKMMTLEPVTEESTDAKEQRFLQWLNFTSFSDQFVKITANDHGIPPQSLKPLVNDSIPLNTESCTIHPPDKP